MNVAIDPDLEDVIRRQLESGRYQSTNDVLRDALHLIETRDRQEEALRADIREKIAAGAASLRRGEWHDGDIVFDELDAELTAKLR